MYVVQRACRAGQRGTERTCENGADRQFRNTFRKTDQSAKAEKKSQQSEKKTQESSETKDAKASAEETAEPQEDAVTKALREQSAALMDDQKAKYLRKRSKRRKTADMAWCNIITVWSPMVKSDQSKIFRMPCFVF